MFKWPAYQIVVHRRDAYNDKKKTMSDVKYIYLFFKVDKCSDLVTYDNGGLSGVAIGELIAGRPVSVEGQRSDIVADEVIVGQPVSIEGLPSDVA